MAFLGLGSGHLHLGTPKMNGSIFLARRVTLYANFAAPQHS